MINEAELKQVKKNYIEVDEFYKERLEKIENKIKENKQKVENIKQEQQNMISNIEKIENEIKDINGKESNHVNGNLKFRLKNFGLEREIFNKGNEIKRLEKELEWKKKMDEIEIKFLKDKNDGLVQDYEKLYNEKTKINEAIIIEILKDRINKYGDIKAAIDIRKENDSLFANLLNENK